MNKEIQPKDVATRELRRKHGDRKGIFVLLAPVGLVTRLFPSRKRGPFGID
jgi:hypothetical protein